MANTKAATNFRNSVITGKQSALPPKCPFPAVSPSCGDYGSVGLKGIPRPRDGQRHHQRTSSEIFAIEEQPSWLDDLLNEPETPVNNRRGAHRRSSSDSFAYLDGANILSSVESIAQEECGHRSISTASGSSMWGLQDFDNVTGKNSTFYAEVNSFGRPQPRGWDAPLNVASYGKNIAQVKDKISNHSLSHPHISAEPDSVISQNVENNEQQEFYLDSKDTFEKKDVLQSKNSEVDQKRAKQQFAQRSRVRKLQYIAELERTVQALQAEGLEASAEVEFLDRQNLILNLENKNLKQKLESLAQEKFIKHLQQEMLEREIARLRMLYQQHQLQQPQQQVPSHHRSSSKDLDSQFSALSLKHKDTNSECDTVTASLRI